MTDSFTQSERVGTLIEEALAWVGRAWDDGNGSGLDGWVGPGRGAGEVDREAQHARTRLVHKADAALRAAAEASEASEAGEVEYRVFDADGDFWASSNSLGEARHYLAQEPGGRIERAVWRPVSADGATS